MAQLALMQVFTVLPVCLSPVIGVVNQLVHFAEVSELVGINFSHGGTYITSDEFSSEKDQLQKRRSITFLVILSPFFNILVNI